MAHRYMNAKKKNVIQSAVKRLQRSLLLTETRTTSSQHFNEEKLESSSVPKGHFAVVAMKSEMPRRFVVPLSYLRHPTFLTLLDQAEEEYGFQCNGAISIPCHPSVIEKILA